MKNNRENQKSAMVQCKVVLIFFQMLVAMENKY